MTTRLVDIVIRQRKGRVRDVLFACAIALATILGATAVGTAARGAPPHHLARGEEPRRVTTQDTR